MTLYLYGGTKTRVSMPKWYMAEKGIDHEYVNIDLSAGDNLAPDYLNINPFGKLPALKDDTNGLTLFESGAILQYLSENYTNEVKNAATRASISQWILFANSTLAIALFVPSNKEREFPRLMTTLNDLYSKKQFLVGESWTAADCAVNAYLGYLPIFYPNESLSAYPAIQALNERTRSNHNYRHIMGL
ncbi:glutathione S-transferase [Synechococcus sp. KORDI-52]|uniref:glutathione S-transferase family protein n=1 Tax=Synechococcus sp. KORDI-52 TaxID=585425 RepID=UPI0004E03546|nr:glutathione S-transferase family protein [Synechococcus sp. KORDI-52]AII48982.1 glutathione S-transferase [Synechococcus sp. KORDI-52]